MGHLEGVLRSYRPTFLTILTENLDVFSVNGCGEQAAELPVFGGFPSETGHITGVDLKNHVESDWT